MSQDLLIHTVGHSDHATEVFLELLRRHGITLVVDVRSQPYSRWTPQFNRETLARDLQDAGIAYQFMGDTLGGRPTGRDPYDPGQERPSYQRVSRACAYRAGIDRLVNLAGTGRVAVMCSEGDHRQCHRHLLVSQTLLEQGVHVSHIQPDGTTVAGELIPKQLSLF